MTSYYAVSNWKAYQDGTERPGRRHTWLRLDRDVFTDPEVCKLSNDGKLAWIGMLCAARRSGNRVPTDQKGFMLNSGLVISHFKLHIARMLELGLIEIVTEEEGKPAEEQKPVLTAPDVKPRNTPGLSKTKGEAAVVDRPENRQGIEDMNRILGLNFGPTLTWLGAFERLRAGGYTRDQWISVFEAVKSGNGSTSKWVREKLRENASRVALYMLRPGEEKAGFDLILAEAASFPNKPAQAQQPLSFEARMEFEKMRQARLEAEFK